MSCILLSLIAILGSEHCYCYFKRGDTEPQRGYECVPRSHNRKLIYLGTEHRSFYHQKHFCSKRSVKKTPLPIKEKLIRERNIHRKWKNHHGSEGPCSILQKLWVAQCCSRMQTAEEMKGRKSNPQMHPQFQACSSPVPRGAALPFPKGAQCCGSAEENSYWFSYLESATLFGCVWKWQSTWALHLLPSLKLKGRE